MPNYPWKNFGALLCPKPLCQMELSPHPNILSVWCPGQENWDLLSLDDRCQMASHCLLTKLPHLFGVQDRGIGTFPPPAIGVKWHRLRTEIPHLFGNQDGALGIFPPSAISAKLHRLPIKTPHLFGIQDTRFFLPW